MSSAEPLWVPTLFVTIAALFAWAAITWSGADEEAHQLWVLSLLPNPAARFALAVLSALFALFAIGAWRGGAWETAAIAGALSLGIVMMVLAVVLILFGALACLAAVAACLWLIYATATRPAEEMERKSRLLSYLGAVAGLIWSIGWTAQVALQFTSGDIDAVLATLRWDAMFVVSTNLVVAVGAFVLATDASPQKRLRGQTKRRKPNR